MMRQARGSLEPIREESASDVKPREIATVPKQASDPQSAQPERKPKQKDPKCTCVIAMRDEQSSTGSKCRLSQTSTVDSKKSYSSILQRPFAFRRAVSLDRAVSQQERRLIELYAKEQRQATIEEEDTSSKASITESTSGTTTKSTETSCVGSDIVDQQGRLMYLMGLSPDVEEARSVVQLEEEVVSAPKEVEQPGESEAMRQAQKYLRIHRIFEFFQFLISHLLGALPENPINFLLDLLDKCIIYRAGMGNPPLLYEKKHLNALFNLMDRMRTGYIDLKQYAAGMKTLGICSYNQHPPVSSDNLVFRDTFIEEAYENLMSILNDIIKRRFICPGGHTTAAITTPPPTPLNALSKVNSRAKWTEKSNKSAVSEKSKK